MGKTTPIAIMLVESALAEHKLSLLSATANQYSARYGFGFQNSFLHFNLENVHSPKGHKAQNLHVKHISAHGNRNRPRLNILYPCTFSTAL
jgi:hypothetical protein